MKAALASAILLAVSAVDAKAHRLCCCVGIDEEAPGKWSDKTVTCLKTPNKEVVSESGGKFIMSNQLWNYRKDSRYPLNTEAFNWFYAANTPFDDNWVGGDESAGLCKAKGYGSACFSPKIAEYRNAGSFKRSENINQQGDVVVVERDVVERKENSTKTPKHHDAGHHKSKTSTHHKSKTSTHHKNKTSTHHKNKTSTHHKNKTSTHHKKPKSTASPVQVRDLFERDLEERKANGTKHAKPKGHKNKTPSHHKNKTSSHKNKTSSHKSKTSSHKKNKTSKTHSKKPKSTASPVQVRDLFERDLLEERKANGTKHAKPKGHKHKTPSHHKNKTSSHHKTKTSSHKKNKTSTHHKKPKSTASPVQVRDLFERDLLEERKANGTKHTKSHGGHHKNKTSSHHHKNKTSSHHHKNKTSTHHQKPKSTASPVQVRDLFERDLLEERKANGTKHTKPHGGHHKNKTSSHHHKSKTSSHKNKTSSHKHKTSSHKKPKSTAAPVRVRDLFERDAN